MLDLGCPPSLLWSSFKPPQVHRASTGARLWPSELRVTHDPIHLALAPSLKTTRLVANEYRRSLDSVVSLDIPLKERVKK
jgi:hypothetical protein